MTRKDVIDVDTVRVERGQDFEISGTYRVLAGNSILLGYLARDQRRRWEARTATLDIPRGSSGSSADRNPVGRVRSCLASTWCWDDLVTATH